MNDYIIFGTEKINFHLAYSKRKTLGITVTPDLDVMVNAPSNTSHEKIIEKVKKKAPWIIKQQRFFLSFHPKTPIRRYVAGETHLYLGRQYRLKITIAKTKSVKLRGKFIEVTTPDKSKVEYLVNAWYLQNANKKLYGIALPLIDNFKKYKVEPSSIVLRHMRRRWGSCTPKGKITLNPELIKAPKGCIEYVIIHELSHLVYHDHTQKFLDLQTREMPDWQKWKRKLELLLS